MPDPTIAELHDLYCKLTGFHLPMRMGRDRAWFDYDKAGFTAEDLILVIGWIRRQMNIARSGYTMASLRFSTLLQLDYFEEKLHLARMDKRASQRPARVTQREQRVGDVRRQVEVPNDGGDPKQAGNIAEDQLRQLKELRHQLGGTAVPTS